MSLEDFLARKHFQILILKKKSASRKIVECEEIGLIFVPVVRRNKSGVEPRRRRVKLYEDEIDNNVQYYTHS
jgi:hypothetical protein